jgi:hypothetical protein
MVKLLSSFGFKSKLRRYIMDLSVADPTYALPVMSSLCFLGRAVQVDPIKPTLKAPRTWCLKVTRDKLLSSFAFKFNLRRYTWV